jgi:hypothetical protein
VLSDIEFGISITKHSRGAETERQRGFFIVHDWKFNSREEVRDHMRKGFLGLILVVFVGLIFLSVDVLTATQVRETIMIANRYKKYEKGLQGRLHRMPS